MTNYGLWQENIEITGQSYAADLIAPHYAARAGFKNIYAINEVPSQFEAALITASQVCDVPHTWRVKQCNTESEVTTEILALGKQILDKDRKELNAHIFAYLGQVNSSKNEFEFLAAGAIRNKLTKDYQNNEYPVVSRAIVSPTHRGKGIGSLIVEHRIKTCLNYFGVKPKAIHFGTESKKILHSIKNIEQELDLKFVYIGDEVYQATDGDHTVNDYLCFLPWFKQALLSACDELKSISNAPNTVNAFKSSLELFCNSGIEQVTGAQLAELFNQMSSSLAITNLPNKSFALISEVFLVKSKIGAEDPNR
jgi:GNAT superfamily N-acetyltransferase